MGERLATRSLSALLETRFRALLRSWKTTAFFAFFELKKQSAHHGLGLVWAILNPLLQISVYIFMFTMVLGLRLPGAGDSPFAYSVYILQGLVPWLYVSTCLNAGTEMVRTYGPFIRQPAFPYRILPGLVLLTNLPAHAIGVLAIVTMMALSGTLGQVNLPLLLMVYFLLFTAVKGMATAFGAIAAIIPDFRNALTIVLLLTTYLSPIFYLPSQMGRLVVVGMLNPFSYMLTSFKYALTSDAAYTMFGPATDIAVLALIALAAAAVERKVLRSVRKTGIDHVG